MAAAARHTFNTSDPVKRYNEQLRFYIKLRGEDYSKAMPVARTTASDCLQLAEQWTAAFLAAVPTFAMGIATEWKGIAEIWSAAVDRLKASELKPADTYDDNKGFWLSLRKLASQLGALDMVVTPGEVLVWAVTDTVREHAETVKEHAQAVYDAGRDAVDTASRIAGAIPTIAKALAVSAVGLGVYAIARRNH